MNIQSLTQTTQQPTQTVVFLKGDEVQEEEKSTNQPQQKKKKPTRNIQWQEDTVDNEHLGRLKSSVCCIYHKPKDLVNPSSGTCTSDDDGNELDRDRITKKKHKKSCSKHTPQDAQDGDQNNSEKKHDHHHHHHCHNHNNHNHHGHSHNHQN